MLPLWAPGLLLIGAAIALFISGDRSAIRSAVMIIAALSVATVAFTPLWLHLFAGVSLEQAVQVALTLAVRLAAMLAIGLALAAALPPVAWLASTRRFPRLGLVLTLTFRQVPELAAETDRIRRAQRARGLLLGPRLTHPVGIVVPLVVRSLERAGRTGEALTLAGWTEGRPATIVVRPARGWRDVLWSIAGLALLTAATLTRIN